MSLVGHFQKEAKMNEDACRKLNTDDQNLIIALYTQAMEDLRHRNQLEWQTFAVVNVIYLGLLKVLYDYKCTITPFWAVMSTIFVIVFTWIWFIRIWGNAKRAFFATKMRNNIQRYVKSKPSLCDLIPCRNVGGGWKWWNRSWPLWSYRGICGAILLYGFALVVGIINKAHIAWPNWMKWPIIPVVIIGIVIGFLLDRKYYYQDMGIGN
jgi:hypothetical protein